MQGLWKYDLLVVASIGIAIAFGRPDNSAEVTAKHEKAAAEAKADIKPEDALWLRLPLECEQWIATRGAGERWRKLPVCADQTKRAQK